MSGAGQGRGEGRRISILGATGSIGRSTLETLSAIGGHRVVAVTGHGRIEDLARIAHATGAEVAVTADPARYAALKDALAGSSTEPAAGPEALVEAARHPADITMSAIVGAAGLAPTLAAIEDGRTIALANKECLVCAGNLLLDRVAQAGGTLLPVDSEHNAIFQVLDGRAALERLILTASGGPFRTWTREQMARATPEQAVAHPNWSMGARISIDSASLFNKGLEMIEAWRLFPVSPGRIEVLIHPQSIIHSMVGYTDGSILAQLGPADMRVAIGYALAWPDRAELPVERLDFAALSRLDFEPPDETRFPALRLARAAMLDGGRACAILNAAKEVAQDSFMNRVLSFTGMAEVVEETLVALAPTGDPDSLEEVFALDGRARAAARDIAVQRAV